jgi:S-adenosylmethionine decarboxylase
MIIMTNITPAEKIKLSGFNNLTKILSFNLYDFCIAFDEKQKENYLDELSKKYCADKIMKYSREVCKIINSEIISESKMDYEPVGASTMTLMSDVHGSEWEPFSGSGVKQHLTKSHLTSHTYPDVSAPNGVCTFRVDFDIATCGDIIPLSAINYLFKVFQCDVVYIDYVVRGYTRLECGKKIYNDHQFNSIQDFIDPNILSEYEYHSDLNIPRDNIWQTKMMVKNTDKERFLANKKDINHPDIDKKLNLLFEEMREVYHLS